MTQLIRDAFLIDGRWTKPTGAGRLDVISPITEGVFGRVPEATDLDVDAAVRAARRAFDAGPWPRMSVEERGDHVLRLTDAVRPRLAEAITLQVEEMGSPFSFIGPATGAALDAVQHQIDVAAEIDTCEIRDGVAGKVVVLRQPRGVVAGIIPWNAPLPLAFSKLVPSLLTGCPIILKPAPEAPLSAYLVAEAAVAAGFPDGVLSLIAGGRSAGASLVAHPGVDRVSFTGSSAAGMEIAMRCAQQLKSVTLELGGKSAAIVLDDVDLDREMATLVDSAMPNNGQVCYATTRILVPRPLHDEVVDRLCATIAASKVGNPHDPLTQFGPLVSAAQRHRVEHFIRSGRDQGATVALGGGRPELLPTGWYVEPTVFVGVDNSMQIAQQEIFGPVVCVLGYGSEDEAIAIANDSAYGLGGAVFTTDLERGLRIARRIQTGTCRINEAPPAGGGGPFGGVKRSGQGRERSREGFESYYEMQSIALPPGYTPAQLAGVTG